MGLTVQPKGPQLPQGPVGPPDIRPIPRNWDPDTFEPVPEPQTPPPPVISADADIDIGVDDGGADTAVAYADSADDFVTDVDEPGDGADDFYA